jgi:hypothetical protein
VLERLIPAVAMISGLALIPTPASAQPQQARVEVSGGFRGVAPVRFDPAAATETTFGGGVLTVFETRSRLGTSAGGVARVGVRLGSSWWLESGLAVSGTGLETHVIRDRDTGATTLRESLTQYVVEGAVLRRIERGRTGRVEPFLAGGGGFIRQLHDGRTFAESGWSAHVGGGLHYLFSRSPTSSRPTGLRFDVRGMLLPSSVALDGRNHVAAVVEAALFIRFQGAPVAE